MSVRLPRFGCGRIVQPALTRCTPVPLALHGAAAVAPSTVVPVPHLPLSLLLAQGDQLALLSWRDVGLSAELVADAVSVPSPLRKGFGITVELCFMSCNSQV